MMHAFWKGFTVPGLWEMFGTFAAGIIGMFLLVVLVGVPVYFVIIKGDKWLN